MDDIKIIEKGKQSLNFVEQLQNQIQLCREALSDNQLPLSPKVQALESLLWAKLKDDFEYTKTMKQLDEWFMNKVRDMKAEEDLSYKQLGLKNQYRRTRAKEQFKAIIIFIDKKGFMPIGEANE
jgi:cysteinyl-tRNA synthetase